MAFDGKNGFPYEIYIKTLLFPRTSQHWLINLPLLALFLSPLWGYNLFLLVSPFYITVSAILAALY
jgi:hypothetical protein